MINPLSANPTKWSNTLKQFVGNLPTNCLSVFAHFVGLALTGLKLEKMICNMAFWKREYFNPNNPNSKPPFCKVVTPTSWKNDLYSAFPSVNSKYFLLRQFFYVNLTGGSVEVQE